MIMLCLLLIRHLTIEDACVSLVNLSSQLNQLLVILLSAQRTMHMFPILVCTKRHLDKADINSSDNSVT